MCEGVSGSWASWINEDSQLKHSMAASPLESQPQIWRMLALGCYSSKCFSDMHMLENPVSLIYVMALGLVINFSVWIRMYFLNSTDLLLKGLSAYMYKKPKYSVRWMMLWKCCVHLLSDHLSCSSQYFQSMGVYFHVLPRTGSPIKRWLLHCALELN